MKVAMLFPSCIFIIALLNTHQLLEAHVEPVVDMQGEPLQAGVGYFVWPIWSEFGGLTLRPLPSSQNYTCPLVVNRIPSFIGDRVFLRAPGLGYIPTETDLTIHADLPMVTQCPQSTVWQVDPYRHYGPSVWFVTSGGDPQSVNSKFKIARLQGDANGIYYFRVCPTVGARMCSSVGTYERNDGTKVMAVGNLKTYYVRFQKYPPTMLYSGQEKNQALSSL